MRKLILSLLLFGFLSAGHSQILLEEARVDYQKKSMKIDPQYNSLSIKIPEKYIGEFQEDPLTFMKNTLDINKIIADNNDKPFHIYRVKFVSNKGFFEARFNQAGDLISSFQKFKNVRLPENARFQILEKHRDAIIVGNKYLASTKGWDIDKAFFKVKIKDGDNKIVKMRINKDRELLRLTGL